MTILVGPHIGLVVEGPGDVNALPLLLRAYTRSVGDFRDILGKPIPLNSISKATVSGGIEGYCSTAARRPGCKAVLVVVDSDKHCPAEFGESLRSRAQGVIEQPVVVAAAQHNFEDWIFASAESLDLGLVYSAEASGIAEIKRARKPLAYVKPVQQPKLTSRMDLES